MESECKQLCQHNEYLYEFFCDQANFVGAIENCKNKGGWLVSDLDSGAYKTINRCIAYAPLRNYYIGLNVSTNNHCVDNQERPYQWIKSGSCTDGSPLTNITLGERRQCVTISFHNSSLPKAQMRNCNGTRRYICQKICPNKTPTIQSTTFATNKQTKLSSNETTLTISFTVNIGAAAFNNFLIPTMIGVVVFIFLAALILLSIFLYKRGCSKRFPNNNERITSTNKEMQNNPFYDR